MTPPPARRSSTRLNWTKVGLKVLPQRRLHTAEPRLNWTKVGLKGYRGIIQPGQTGCLNWTKVGLKEEVGDKAATIFAWFELD